MSSAGERKGIILAGGAGSRLHPLTHVLSKQLLPVYDKPMIYYPLTTLMLGGIREILIITTPDDISLFQKLLKDGSQWGLNIQYAVQESPNGIAQALVLGRDFLGGAPSALILGDNIFYGDGLGQLMRGGAARKEGATIFAYYVSDPERYGIVEFDSGFVPTRLVEKPTNPSSNWAVTGLYFYDGDAPLHAESLKPSDRGELEITDLNSIYLELGNLNVERFGRGFAWLDAGTHQSLLESSQFVHAVESRQSLKIACPEEVAFREGFIGLDQLVALAEPLAKTSYGQYLVQLAERSQHDVV